MITFDETDEEIIDCVLNTKRNIFIHGPAGTGKSTLLREIIARNEGSKKIGLTATTGVAALLIKGQTLHRFLGLGLAQQDVDYLYKRIVKNKKAENDWKKIDMLIIDEVSMLGGKLFSKIDDLAKRIRKNMLPFGGIQLVFVGDLFQLPPVKDIWIFESEAYKQCNFKFFNLTKSKRYENSEYFDMLLRIREGVLIKEDYKKLKKCVKKYQNMSEFKKIVPTVLYSRKVNVEEYNQKKLDQIDKQEFTFVATDIFQNKEAGIMMKKTEKDFFKNILDENIPHTIHLKVGAQVMLKKNFIDSKLSNGSRGVVVALTSRSVLVEFTDGDCVEINYEQWDMSDENHIVIRQQIPLVLAYSITCHKSQGSTLDCVVCDIGPSVFAYAQAYVALSRVRDIDGLYISNLSKHSIRADPKVVAFIKSIDEKCEEVEKELVHNKDYDAETCIVCMENKKNTLFKHGSTSHYACCKICSDRIVEQTNKCPICRENIDELITVF